MSLNKMYIQVSVTDFIRNAKQFSYRGFFVIVSSIFCSRNQFKRQKLQATQSILHSMYITTYKMVGRDKLRL